MKGISNKEAYLELVKEGKVYPMPTQPSPKIQERQPLPLEKRHQIYSEMLDYLTLLPKHKENSSKRALPTEGPLKGDVASFLAGDALFVCIGGVNALGGLKDTLRSLGIREVVEAMDMDQNTNKQVRQAIRAMRREVESIPGIRYTKYTWNPAYKGVDDYFLSRVAAL